MEGRTEFVDGEVFSMTDARLAHNAIVTDFASLTDHVPLASIDCYLAVAEVYGKLAIRGS